MLLNIDQSIYPTVFVMLLKRQQEITRVWNGSLKNIEYDILDPLQLVLTKLCFIDHINCIFIAIDDDVFQRMNPLPAELSQRKPF